MYKLLNAKQACKLLGVSENTIRNWAKRGIIKTMNVGKVSYYSEDSLKQLSKDLGRNKDVDEYNKLINKSLLESKKLNKAFKHELKLGKFRTLLTNTLKGLYNIKELDLTPREIDILEGICDMKLYQEIADNYGCTEEAIGTAARKAFLKVSRAGKIKEHIEELERKNLELREENDKLNVRLNRILSISKLESISTEDLDIDEEKYRILKKEVESPKEDVKIFRIINRFNVKTIGQLAFLNRDELRGINCIGDRTINKLNDYLVNYGLSLNDKYARLLYMNKWDSKKKVFID